MRNIIGSKYHWVYLLCALSMLMLSQSVSGDLVVNEIMTTNETAFQDEYADFDDWVEIHNTTEYSIPLGYFYLSNNLNEFLKWELPDRDI